MHYGIWKRFWDLRNRAIVSNWQQSQSYSYLGYFLPNLHLLWCGFIFGGQMILFRCPMLNEQLKAGCECFYDIYWEISCQTIIAIKQVNCIFPCHVASVWSYKNLSKMETLLSFCHRYLLHYITWHMQYAQQDTISRITRQACNRKNVFLLLWIASLFSLNIYWDLNKIAVIHDEQI